MQIIVLVLVGGVVVVLVLVVLDAIGNFIVVRQTCGLKTFFLRRDACLGTCPPGLTCTATATRSYFFFGTQAAACGCLPPGLGGGPLTPPPGGIPPGTPGTPGVPPSPGNAEEEGN